MSNATAILTVAGGFLIPLCLSLVVALPVVGHPDIHAACRAPGN
jgi:hypothetical protein